MKDKISLNVLDLFCGCGGLSLGFMQAGFEIKIGIDSWGDAINTYTDTHKFAKGIIADLFLTTPDQIEEQTGIHRIDVIIGGPPCQGFSIAGKRIIDDERNKLYRSFVKFVKHYQPKVFLMENVPNIMSMGNGIIKEQIIKDFNELGYSIKAKNLIASDYGIPQKRKRAFFIGFKDVSEFEFPEPIYDKFVNTEEAISDLPEYSLKDGESYPLNPQSEYQVLMRGGSKGVYNHQITEHTEKTKHIISLVPDGGNYKNLPSEFLQSRNVNIAWTRLDSKKPSFTIDTGHRHHFHYNYNRVPTVRESARIQSFPDNFIFKGTKTSQYKQVGNAVPPMLAKILAKKIKEYLR